MLVPSMVKSCSPKRFSQRPQPVRSEERDPEEERGHGIKSQPQSRIQARRVVVLVGIDVVALEPRKEREDNDAKTVQDLEGERKIHCAERIFGEGRRGDLAMQNLERWAGPRNSGEIGAPKYSKKMLFN
jgi:hypothetical protein